MKRSLIFAAIIFFAAATPLNAKFFRSVTKALKQAAKETAKQVIKDQIPLIQVIEDAKKQAGEQTYELENVLLQAQELIETINSRNELTSAQLIEYDEQVSSMTVQLFNTFIREKAYQKSTINKQAKKLINTLNEVKVAIIQLKKDLEYEKKNQ